MELPDRGRVTSLVSKLPFASADPDPAFLLERKQGLEKYLQVDVKLAQCFCPSATL